MIVALLIFLSCPLSTLELVNEINGDSSSRTPNQGSRERKDVALAESLLDQH